MSKKELVLTIVCGILLVVDIVLFVVWITA